MWLSYPQHTAAFLSFRSACALKQHSTVKHQAEMLKLALRASDLGGSSGVSTLAEHAAQAEKQV